MPGFAELRDGLVICGLSARERAGVRAPRGVCVRNDGIWVYVLSNDVEQVTQMAQVAIARAAAPKSVSVPVHRCALCGEANPQGMLCPMSENGEGPHQVR